MTSYDELQRAFLAYRRALGRVAALKLITDHGGTTSLDSVPEGQRAALLAAFRKGLPQHMKTLARAVAQQASDNVEYGADAALAQASADEMPWGHKPFKRQALEDEIAVKTVPTAPIDVDDDGALAAARSATLDPAKIYAKWNSAGKRNAE